MRIYRSNVEYYRTRLSLKPKAQLDENVQAFIDRLAQSDKTILNAFKLTLDGRALTEQEAKRFIAYIRSELNDKKAPPQNTSS